MQYTFDDTFRRTLARPVRELEVGAGSISDGHSSADAFGDV
jgi:hypothetical protein